jgi:hypothetical protein
VVLPALIYLADHLCQSEDTQELDDGPRRVELDEDLSVFTGPGSRRDVRPDLTTLPRCLSVPCSPERVEGSLLGNSTELEKREGAAVRLS